MDRLQSLAILVKTVEFGSISAAANELDISSQLAGKHIRHLEQTLGIKLLNRTTRKQSLSDSGRIFYEHAKTILAEFEAAEMMIAETRSTARGRLRISAPVTFGSRALAPELPEYLADHPEVSVDLSLSNRPVDLIEDGFDVVFRTGELPDSSLAARRLAPLRLVLCAAPEYLKSASPILTPEDLKEHECLVFSHTSLRANWNFNGPNGPIEIPIKGRFATDSGEALRAAAVSGMGVLLQPLELVSDELVSGRLRRILQDYEPPARQLHALYAADRRMTPKLRTFLDFSVRKFGKPKVSQ
ncbi:lysR substrate binding domain protein [Brucella grignonensis]|uniref:LysR substrate binding domain protein n=2 Tax=Brucella grignonensis TaxID=94627 RepID=A0A256EYP5_9HYPH|nr:lysR substrate binding domain protein [Brucella grignonensis]